MNVCTSACCTRKASSKTRFHEQYLIICIQSRRDPGTLPSPWARQVQITMNFSQQANVSLPPSPSNPSPLQSLPLPTPYHYPIQLPPITYSLHTTPSHLPLAPSRPLPSLSASPLSLTPRGEARRLAGSRRISGNRLIKREKMHHVVNTYCRRPLISLYVCESK